VRWLALAIVACVACGSDQFIVITIDTRPAVHGVAELDVELTNNGTSRGDTFEVTSESFPATFSVSAPGRTGDLQIEITAHDAAGLVVGHGLATTTVDTLEARILIDSTDFVVNTEFADDQFPSNDFESHGFQVGSAPDGTWTAVYRDTCSSPCNMFGRRFDVSGTPVESGLAAGIGQFAISTELSDGFFTTPAAASNGQTTITTWNFSEPSPSTNSGIACRALDAAGNGVGSQVTVSLETTFPFAVSVTPLSTGKFSIAWDSTNTDIIRSAIVNAQCQVSNPLDVSTATGTGGAIRPAVAANGDRILYAWVLDGTARVRTTSTANNPITNDGLLVNKTATDQVRFVRVAPLGDGFAVVVRWAAISGTGPGKIELYRTSNQGQQQGAPTLVTTRTDSNFATAQGFSVASRDDGALLVAWHACDANGDDSGCGVFGRVLRPTGVPVGDEFSLATTTDLDQLSPSVAGLPGAFVATWRDNSGKDPDKSGAAVRARILYPSYDDAVHVIGATCTTATDCDEGLICGPASDGGKRCFVSCDPAGAPPQCPAGGTCSPGDGGSACVF